MAPAPGFEPGSSARQAEMIARLHHASAMADQSTLYIVFAKTKLHSHVKPERWVSSFSVTKEFLGVTFFHHGSHQNTDSFL